MFLFCCMNINTVNYLSSIYAIFVLIPLSMKHKMKRTVVNTEETALKSKNG